MIRGKNPNPAKKENLAGGRKEDPVLKLLRKILTRNQFPFKIGSLYKTWRPQKKFGYLLKAAELIESKGGDYNLESVLKARKLLKQALLGLPEETLTYEIYYNPKLGNLESFARQFGLSSEELQSGKMTKVRQSLQSLFNPKQS